MAEDGRAADFAAFYRQFYGLILTTVERRVTGLAAAEDVVSEVFRVAWQRHSAGEELSLPWLYGVARNLIGNEYRRATRSKNLDERLRDHDTARETGADDALDVARGLERLRAADREILQLVYWDDLTGDEVAEVLGITPATARVRLLRARNALRRALEQTGANVRG